MTDLTDKWKKGELPSGYYYVKNEFGNIFPSDYSEDYDYISDTVIKDFFTEVSEIKEVLEPVPSYKEWQASEKYNKHLEEKIKIYERKDKQATETSIAYNELAEENTKLKTENKWYSEQLNEAVKKIDKLKEQKKPTSDCRTLAQKLLQVKPELRDWLDVNFKEYL